MIEFACRISFERTNPKADAIRTLVCDAKSRDRKRWQAISLDITGKNRRQITALMRKARETLSESLS